MLEDRKMMMRLFPDLFAMRRVALVAHHPDLLLETLRAWRPTGRRTHGGGADAGHVQQRLLRARLPGAADGRSWSRAGPVRRDNFVYMRTTRGPMRVDVIYRRVDDDFLDPQVFRPDSTLGCAGCWTPTAPATWRSATPSAPAWRTTSRSTLRAEDDRVLPGRKAHPEQRAHATCAASRTTWVRAGHLATLVVKEVHGAGGYGMLVGPAATKAEIEEFRSAVANPITTSRSPRWPVHLPDLRGIGHRAAPHRPAPLRAVGQVGADGARRASTRVALKGGRWWSTRRRAAAPRTPGFWRKKPMLSRTADHLFWMSRHRAGREHRAHARRQLPDLAAAAVGRRGREQGWRACCPSSELLGLHRPARRGQRAQRDGVHGQRRDNPRRSSPACAPRARTPVPCGTLTTEVWETQNQTWLEVQPHAQGRQFERDRASSSMGQVPLAPQSRGVTVGTMLMDEALHFIRLGTFLERADNTARLLDVKFHAGPQRFHFGPPAEEGPGGSTSTTGARSCARSRASRSTARSTAT